MNSSIHFFNLAATIFCLALLIILPAQQARAEATVPEELQGYWYLLSCHHPQMMMINTEYFSLQIEQGNRVNFIPVREPKKYNDYYGLILGRTVSAFYPGPDGTLLYNVSPTLVSKDTAPEPLPQNWAEIKNGFNLPYVKCSDNDTRLKNINAELAAFLPAYYILDRLRPNCPYTGREENQACHKIFFDSFDQDNDEALSYDELTLLYQAVDFLHGAVSNNEEEKDSLTRAKEFARDIASLIDQSDPQKMMLTYEKTKEIWTELSKFQNGQVFIAKIDLLQQIIADDLYETSSCGPDSYLDNAAIPQATLNAEGNSCIMEGESYLEETSAQGENKKR